MAEGWLRHLAGDRYESFSASTHPVGLNPGAVEAMNEIGVDIAGHRSKPVTELLQRAFDIVITVCGRAKESCPVWPEAARIMHWSFEDPAAVGEADARRDVFRRVRHEIGAAVRGFITSVEEEES